MGGRFFKINYQLFAFRVGFEYLCFEEVPLQIFCLHVRQSDLQLMCDMFILITALPIRYIYVPKLARIS